MNIADSIPEPLAGEEFTVYKKVTGNKPVTSNLFYHWARAIELLY